MSKRERETTQGKRDYTWEKRQRRRRDGLGCCRREGAEWRASKRVATSGDRGSRRERSTLGLSAVRGAISSGPPLTPFQRRRRRQCGSESIGTTTELSVRGGFHPTSLKVKPDAKVILEMPHLESFVVPFPGLGSSLRLMITFVKLGRIRQNS